MRKRNNSAPNRVGLIGTGKIGHGMAVNLIQAGHDVRVLAHKTRTAAEDLVKRGASEATSLRALVGECGVIFLCLPDSKVVEEIMLGVDGIVGVNRPGLMVIDTSTSQPESTRHIAREMQERGMAFADAPVLRSAVEAEAGTLISLFGGTHEIFDLVRPMIAAYSEQVIHFGTDRCRPHGEANQQYRHVRPSSTTDGSDECRQRRELVFAEHARGYECGGGK